MMKMKNEMRKNEMGSLLKRHPLSAVFILEVLSLRPLEFPPFPPMIQFLSNRPVKPWASGWGDVTGEPMKGMIKMPDHLVYSTDGGRINTCPRCGLPYAKCRCDQPLAGQQFNRKSDGIVRIMRDKKHRGGKTVTVNTG